MLEYSTLKPDTSSDSASVKSNGTLLVSARADTKNITAPGYKGKINHTFCWQAAISIKAREAANKITEMMISPMDTSPRARHG